MNTCQAETARLKNHLAFQMVADDVQILFVDLQPQLTRASKTNPPDSLAANAGALAKIAALLDVPITFSLVEFAGEDGQLIPELTAFATDRNTRQRRLAKSFLDQQLVQTLAAVGRPVLVVAGYATEVAVLHTVIGALKLGYRVHYVVDAVGSQSIRTEDAAFRQMEMAGAIPTSIMTLAAHLAPDFTQPPGLNVLATFADLRKSP